MIVDCAIYRDGHRTDGPEDFSDALGERGPRAASSGSGCTNRRRTSSTWSPRSSGCIRWRWRTP
ncbi:hypothetical protein LV779_09465 [Streptomyces thinghirensis]|nr:hypothetical protein [Streptomyces thinghirensis]